MQVILVEPLGETWRVRAEGRDLVFKSGGAAEQAARRLGERLSGAGQPAEIRIYLRNGALGGRFVCPPGGTVQPLPRAIAA